MNNNTELALAGIAPTPTPVSSGVVKVPRELANIAILHLEFSGYPETSEKLRTLLAQQGKENSDD